MENSYEIVKQLKIIKWAVVSILLGTLISVGALCYTFYISSMAISGQFTETSCKEGSFRDLVSNMLDENKLDEGISLANERVKTHPNDQDAYWYRGRAYLLQEKWQLAIDDFDQPERLAPSWKSKYIDPYRSVAQQKLKKH